MEQLLDGIEDFNDMQNEVSDLYGGRDDIAIDTADLENELEAMIRSEPVDESFKSLEGNKDSDSAGFMVTAASVLGVGGAAAPNASELPTEDVEMTNERAALLDHMGM